MGAWNFVHGRLHRMLARPGRAAPHRPRASASPASGSTKVHDREQEQLLAAAFADL